MDCNVCGTANSLGAKFCVECGNRLAVVCPNCGTQNLPAAKFCQECATPLGGGTAAVTTTSAPATRAAAGPIAERRLVSVLFIDLVSWTTIAAGRDAEEARELLSRYFDLARDVIGRYGGTVEKFIGDAVMAVWGAPTAREDDAERAVRAGLDLIVAVRTLGSGIEARAGVLTGEAAVTIGATNQGMVAGDIVNVASRLQSAAPAGAVFVGEATQRAAGKAIVFEPAGEQVLKGKEAPVAAWRALRVVAQRGGVGRSEALEAPFVGRDEELRQLKELFHATSREGRARLISVIGPAGIGKTRLAWEFEKYLDGLVERVWWHAGRSPAYGDGITFWALGEMVRGRAGLVETDDEPTSRAKIAETLRTHVPDDAERAWIEPALLTLLGVGGATMSSEQLFAAWRTFFERLAASGPVVMVFEDLHFADPGLLDFIDHVLEWSRNAPITIITLARRELLEKRPTWGAGKLRFTSVALEPLPASAMRELLSGLVPGLPTAAAEAIVTRADGIPLYAVETVRMLLSQGRLVLEGGVYRPTGDLGELAVPETLTALIAARLDALEADARTLIADAAVLGQSFTPAALASVAGSDAATIEPRLRDLVRRELLVHEVDARSPERGQFAFVQALIREVAYNTLSKKDRKVRHLAAARFFEGLGSEELAGALAGHYLAAQRLAADDAEADALAAQARIALRGAAERAARLGSHEQALTFYDQALLVTADPAERAALHGQAMRSARQGLDPAAIERHALAALEERRRVGDREAIAAATADYALTISSWLSDPARARTVLEPAWEEFSDLEETAAGVGLMTATTSSLRDTADVAEQLRWVDRLLPIAERLGLVEETANAIATRGAGLIGLDRTIEGTMLLRGALQLAFANELTEVERRCRVLLTFFGQWADPVEALALAREGLERARQVGSRSFGFLMVGNGVVCALRVGDWDWATELLDEWIAVGAATYLSIELFIDRAILTSLRGGDPKADLAAAAPLQASVTDPQFASYEHLGHAWADLAAGRLADSQRRAEAAARIEFFHPISAPLAARAALWAGDGEAARRILDGLKASAYRGAALANDKATIQAGLAAIDGRPAEALAAYREVNRTWRSLRLAFDEALTGLDMVQLLDRDDPEVRAVADASRTIFERLGARPLLARLEAAVGRAAPRATSAASEVDVAVTAPIEDAISA